MGMGHVHVSRTLINFNGWAGVGILDAARSVLTDNVVHNNGQSGVILAEDGHAHLLTNHLCNNGEFAVASFGNASLHGGFDTARGHGNVYGNNTVYGNAAGSIQGRG